MSEPNELLVSAGRSFRSALVVGCFLSLGILVEVTTEVARRAARDVPPMVTVSRIPDTALPGVVRPPAEGGVYGERPGPYPMWRIPPRSHRWDRSDVPVRNPDVWPKLIKSVSPRFSDEARRARVSGIVILEVLVEADGTVRRGTVLKPLPFGLTKPAIEAVQKWRYRPGMVNGKPVATIMNVTVNFRWPPESE